MQVLTNMGLFKWDSVNDYFNHAQHAANITAIDAHDHTAGKGVKIPYGGLAEGAVGPENLKSSVAIPLTETYFADSSVVSVTMKTASYTEITAMRTTINLTFGGSAYISCAVNLTPGTSSDGFIGAYQLDSESTTEFMQSQVGTSTTRIASAGLANIAVVGKGSHTLKFYGKAESTNEMTFKRGKAIIYFVS